MNQESKAQTTPSGVAPQQANPFPTTPPVTQSTPQEVPNQSHSVQTNSTGVAPSAPSQMTKPSVADAEQAVAMQQAAQQSPHVQEVPLQQRPSQQPSSPQSPSQTAFPSAQVGASAIASTVASTVAPGQVNTGNAPSSSPEGVSPLDALQKVPNTAQAVNVVEVEGETGEAISDVVVKTGEKYPSVAQGATGLDSTSSGGDNLVEESLEQLRASYDDAKLNSVIIEQVKELIEIDNNLNTKIEDVKVELNREKEEREKIMKKVDSHYKELKELDQSIAKFIALYEVVTNQFNPFVKQDPNQEGRMDELLHGKEKIKDVAEHQHFISKNGKKIKNIKELSDYIKEMPDEEFKHHVSVHKNDFGLWIHEAVSDVDLAEKVSGQRTKEGILKVLEEHLQ